MSSLRDIKDDALFLGALIAVLGGTGLLLETTGAMPLPEWAGPLLVMAIGGLLLYLAIVRKRSEIFFGAGVFFALSGLVLFLTVGGLGIARSWPLLMTSAGIGWFAYGQWRFGHPRIIGIVPSVIFICLGLFFALFSFHIVTMRIAAFIAMWWPLFLIIGGIALFIAYSLRVRRGSGRRRVPHP